VPPADTLPTCWSSAQNLLVRSFAKPEKITAQRDSAEVNEAVDLSAAGSRRPLTTTRTARSAGAVHQQMELPRAGNFLPWLYAALTEQLRALMKPTDSFVQSLAHGQHPIETGCAGRLVKLVPAPATPRRGSGGALGAGVMFTGSTEGVARLINANRWPSDWPAGARCIQRLPEPAARTH
jgi:hypothetical protein